MRSDQGNVSQKGGIMLSKIVVAVFLPIALSITGAIAQQGQTTKQLLETTTTIAGTPLKYPTGTPKFTAVVSTLEPNGISYRHKHPVPTFIYVLEGTLVVDVDGGVTREVKAG